MFSKSTALITLLIISFSIVSAETPTFVKPTALNSIIVVEENSTSDIFQVQNQSGFLEVVVLD